MNKEELLNRLSDIESDDFLRHLFKQRMVAFYLSGQIDGQTPNN